MSLRQWKRGPDAAGEWGSLPASAGGNGAFFCFRRLKIIDLSDVANQPMVDSQSGNVLVFNGEIYNFRELRAELEKLGHVFRSRSDSEVILKAYAQWGVSCVRRLRGMFAFVVWDPHHRRALLARDRIGIKPLYYAEITRPSGNSTVVFASQLRSILASELVERRLDPVGVSTYVWNGFVAGPGTLIRGIHLLPAGHTAAVPAEGGPLRIDRFWQLPLGREAPGDALEVRHKLSEAIQQHMVSDVPLGVFLSGGKDSTAVATMAARIASEPLKTFTITFEEADYNEAEYARRVAELIRSDHHEVLLSERLFKEQLDDALGSIDQPTFDGINSYFVSRAVKGAGLTVAMAGTGGDELFGGYRSFRDLPWVRRWSRRLGFLPSSRTRRAADGFSRIRALNFGSMPPQTRWGRLADALEARGRLTELYQVAYSLFTNDFARQLVSEGLVAGTHFGLPEARRVELAGMIEGRTVLAAISTLELSMFLGERLLRDTDAASMEVSLEVRVPLLDHEVIEAVCAIDDSRRFLPIGEKTLLRETAMPDLPEYLFDQPKHGFELPLEVWCRRGVREAVGSALRDGRLCESIGFDSRAVNRLWTAYERGVRGLYWSRVWALYVLLWWCRTHRATI
jgi:asparagine synthase (glutamine-hydrolysing)